MVRTNKILMGFLGGLMVCSARGADLAANPYQSIVERNVFHLNPPPAPPDPEANKPPPPKIFLTGITTLMGSRRALLKTAPTGKPGEAAKEKSYMLAEHERMDDLEVLAIDEVAGSVKVSYAGIETTVNFKDNAVATAASAAPAPPVPGAPGAPGGPAPNPGFPGQPPPGMNPFLKQQFPARPIRAGETAPGLAPAPGQPGAANRSITRPTATAV